MQAEQNITSSSSDKTTIPDHSSAPTKSPMESLSLEQIQRLLDDIKLEPHPQNESQRGNPQKEDGFPSDQTQEQEPEQEENTEKEQLKMEDVTINRSEITFGNPGLVPGSIDEIDFSVSLNCRQIQQSSPTQHQNSSYILRIIALCKNEEFDNLDEYVFSVRSNNCYDYFEEIRFKIKRGERADIKVAVKIPQLKKNFAINGIVEPIYVPIVAKCLIPQIVCLKSLYKQDEGVSLIKIPAKKCQQRTPPIPFKNISPFNLTFEVEAISNESYEHKPYDIVVQNFVGCQANAQFFVNMQLRQNVNYTGIYPTRSYIRKILTIKIKNSSLVYYFPIEVSVFEGQALEGN